MTSPHLTLPRRTEEQARGQRELDQLNAAYAERVRWRRTKEGVAYTAKFDEFAARELDRQNDAFVMGLFVKVSEVVK